MGGRAPVAGGWSGTLWVSVSITSPRGFEPFAALIFGSLPLNWSTATRKGGETGDPGGAERAAEGHRGPVPGPADTEQAYERLMAVRGALRRVIRGKDDVIDGVLTAILAEGSVLLEDVPGVGKTTLAKSLAALIELEFRRIQCTPDLLPADILGGSIYQPSGGTFEFRPGPIFCNLLIADEINRASPRTQSALLEAMAESQVTIDGKRYDLKKPFVVIATQNPMGFEGTFPLPESQLDRFLVRLSMDYPDSENEVELLLDQASRDPSEGLRPAMHGDQLVALQRQVREVAVDRKVARYLVDLVSATRRDSRLQVGCSPRGSKMLLRAAQARALMHHRDYVLPDDVQKLAPEVLGHRVALRGLPTRLTESNDIIRELVSGVKVPV